MNSKDNGNRPANPQSEYTTKVLGVSSSKGLTKREVFTLRALSIVMCNYNPYEHGDFDSSEYERTAEAAVGLADALLTQLNTEVSDEE